MSQRRQAIGSDIADKIDAVRQSIDQAAAKAGRNPADIHLLAVSKTRPAGDIKTAFDAGQHDFGENYLQEAIEKIRALQGLPITWHFIGRIQSNKTRLIAENFSWVHTLSSLKHARRISEQRPAQLPAMNVCIQVNISHEASKGGINSDQVEPLAAEISKLPGIRLRGLMAIPEATENRQAQRKAFASLAALFSQLHQKGFKLDTLSMGMSGDMEIAIEEGATIVRIGTAIFGARPPQVNH